ncbi:hypothetical protein ACLOJK_019827 [Asimina triloba]
MPCPSLFYSQPGFTLPPPPAAPFHSPLAIPPATRTPPASSNSSHDSWRQTERDHERGREENGEGSSGLPHCR